MESESRKEVNMKTRLLSWTVDNILYTAILCAANGLGLLLGAFHDTIKHL